MAREIEVKVIGMDINILEEKIIKFGGKLISDEYQENILIDTSEIFKGDNPSAYLRIRKTKDKLNNKFKNEFTLKENLMNNNLRENNEVETEITDVESLLNILEKLGFGVLSIGYKDRKSYILDNMRFDFDIWDENTYPYPYMEIELENEDDLDKAKKLLDIDDSCITTKSILELQRDLKNN